MLTVSLDFLFLSSVCCAKASPGVVSAAVGGLSLQNGFGGFDDSGGEVGADFSGVGEQWPDFSAY